MLEAQLQLDVPNTFTVLCSGELRTGKQVASWRRGDTAGNRGKRAEREKKGRF